MKSTFLKFHQKFVEKGREKWQVGGASSTSQRFVRVGNHATKRSTRCVEKSFQETIETTFLSRILAKKKTFDGGNPFPAEREERGHLTSENRLTRSTGRRFVPTKKNGPRLRRPLKRHKRNREHLFPTESTSLETFRSWWLSRNRPTVPAIFGIITEKLPADGSSAVSSASFFYTLPGNSILAFLFVGRCLEKANWTSFKVVMEIIRSWWIGRCNRGRDDRRSRRKDRVVEKGVTERWKEIK